MLLVRVVGGDIHITQYVHLLCILHTDIRTDYFGIIMYIRIIPFLVYIDPSGVRVMPVAAIQNGSGHDKGHFFLFFLLRPFLFYQKEGSYVGRRTFAAKVGRGGGIKIVP